MELMVSLRFLLPISKDLLRLLHLGSFINSTFGILYFRGFSLLTHTQKRSWKNPDDFMAKSCLILRHGTFINGSDYSILFFNDILPWGELKKTESERFLIGLEMMLMRRGREKLMLPIHRKERDQLQRPQLVSWKLLWTLYLMRAAFFTMYTRIPFFMGLSLLLMPSVRCFSTNR